MITVKEELDILDKFCFRPEMRHLNPVWWTEINVIIDLLKRYNPDTPVHPKVLEKIENVLDNAKRDVRGIA